METPAIWAVPALPATTESTKFMDIWASCPNKMGMPKWSKSRACFLKFWKEIIVILKTEILLVPETCQETMKLMRKHSEIIHKRGESSLPLPMQVWIMQ
jgi:hypothetical protein